MSMKKKYIKLNNENLELETFSLPKEYDSKIENNIEDERIQNSKTLHHSFINVFEPYSKLSGKEQKDEGNLIEGKAVENGSPLTDPLFVYPNEKYCEMGISYEETGVFKKLWYGPENINDVPPFFNPSSWMFKVNEFPKYYQYRINKTTRFLILALATIIHLVFTVCFIYLPYISTSENIIPMECNSRMNYPSQNNNICGLNLKNCGPFESTEDQIVRCPALCDRGGWVYAPVTVGDDRIRYQSYVIGETYYRADSFVCAAAYSQKLSPKSYKNSDDKQLAKSSEPGTGKITSGSGKVTTYSATKKKAFTENKILSDSNKYFRDADEVFGGQGKSLISRFFGGCVKIRHVGAQLEFSASNENIDFDSFYPSSFVLEEAPFSASCVDPRFYLLAINVVFFCLVFYFYESIVSFWWLVTEAFWFQAVVMDPAVLIDPRDVTTIAELVSITTQKFLPLCFILYVLYITTIDKTFNDKYVSPIWKLFWLTFFWVGLLNNITFDRLPVDRLTISDLKEQSGGIAATLLLLSIITGSAIIQGYSLWKAGVFRTYFKLYIIFVSGLVLLGLIPGMGLRIHHYILGILLLPGCATRGKLAYILQGVLIGLILNGIARWDYASIIETQSALLRGSAGDAAKPPVLNHTEAEPIAISWSPSSDIASPLNTDFIGYSLLMNDFEVYVGTNTTVTITKIMESNDLAKKLINGALLYEDSVKLYIRVASCDPNDSNKRGDYTNAAVLYYPSGNWTDPLPGVT